MGEGMVTPTGSRVLGGEVVNIDAPIITMKQEMDAVFFFYVWV